MKLGWIEISFTWHGPGSNAMFDRKLRYAYNNPTSEGVQVRAPLLAAVKCYRRLRMGAGIKEAKDYCEVVCNHPRSELNASY